MNRLSFFNFLVSRSNSFSYGAINLTRSISLNSYNASCNDLNERAKFPWRSVACSLSSFPKIAYHRLLLQSFTQVVTFVTASSHARRRGDEQAARIGTRESRLCPCSASRSDTCRKTEWKRWTAECVFLCTFCSILFLSWTNAWNAWMPLLRH